MIYNSSKNPWNSFDENALAELSFTQSTDDV